MPGVNFIPPNPFNDLMATLFNDEGTADVVLEVGEGDCKRKFYAHRLILTKCAPDLAALCEDCDKDMPLPLPDVDPDIFHELLRFVYGGKVAQSKFVSQYRDFIDTADQFGVINLKIEAEVRYVKAEVMTVDNVVDNLAYADSKNCSRLKECAIVFMMKNPATMKSESFNNVPISMSTVKEIFFVGYMLSQSKKADTIVPTDPNSFDALLAPRRKQPKEEDLERLSIDELRRKLSRKGC